ncbi:hypothetical protein [Azospirillum halopraeferens]|uniref:hypothetical protein n=1 Tax=Azospirillum halopraeferens TaxID=34010 RepID=UPI001B3BB092|nr:hypothetical protein [Azospirillum halopraeferens]
MNACTGFGVGLSAVLVALVGACAGAPPAPDSAYRRALERAVAEGRCDGPAVDGLWSAFRDWYAAGATIAGHDRGDEAAALLRQGDLFLVMGCPEVARTSYAAVPERYPEPALAALRRDAAAALHALPVPVPPPAPPPGPAASGRTNPPILLNP